MVKSGTVTVKANPVALIPTSLSIETSLTSGTIPLTVKISGMLTEAGTPNGIGGRTIYIYRKKSSDPSFPSTPLGSTVTQSYSTELYDKGYYAYTDTLTTEGSYDYQAEFRGDSTYAGCPGSESAERTEDVHLAAQRYAER